MSEEMTQGTEKRVKHTVGRRSVIVYDQNGIEARLEVQPRTGRYPSFERLTGLDEESGSAQWTRFRRDDEAVTNSGNGHYYYVIEDPKVCIPEVLDVSAPGTGGSMLSGYVVLDVDDDGDPQLYDIDRSELREVLTRRFPQRMQRARRISELMTAVAEERQAYETETRQAAVDGEALAVTLEPVFREDRAVRRTIAEAVERDRSVTDERIAELAAPEFYRADAPGGLHGSGQTADEAVESLVHTARKRNEDKRRVRERADAEGLPPLKGTPRQVSWAMDLRDRYVEKHGNDGKAKRATTAKYWIDHRFKLGIQ